MKQNTNIGIVIPCFNEELNFLYDSYIEFLQKNNNVFICFVNDGSVDNTLSILESLIRKFPQNTTLINLEKNGGKAEAVRHGINWLLQNSEIQTLGFIDADLAVSLEESQEVAQLVQQEKELVFGSRILRVGSNIDRKFHRFLIGRFIATIISQILDIKVYDTQCGCKFFTRNVSLELFKESFISKWVFDVELFFRFQKLLGKEQAYPKMLEVPLKSWIDRGDSKVKFSYGFKVFIDLYQIRNTYK